VPCQRARRCSVENAASCGVFIALRLRVPLA
jgi:hypothetical protein